MTRVLSPSTAARAVLTAFAVAFTLGWLPGRIASAAPQAGVAAAVRGTVTLDREAAIGVDVESGAKIHLGDRISTGADSGLQVLLLDETVFTLGPQSAMVIDKFIYDPGTREGKLDAELVRGAFRMISGRISKKDPESVRVRLPAGTIGIRGTIVDSEVDAATGRSLVVLQGPGEGNRAGVPVGSISVENAGVSRDVLRSGWGVEIAERGAPPSEPFLVPIDVLERLGLDARPTTQPRRAGRRGARPAGAGPDRAPARGAERRDGSRREGRGTRPGAGGPPLPPPPGELDTDTRDDLEWDEREETRDGDEGRLPPPPDGGRLLPPPPDGDLLDPAIASGDTLDLGDDGGLVGGELSAELGDLDALNHDQAQSMLNDPSMLQTIEAVTTVAQLDELAQSLSGELIYAPEEPLDFVSGNGFVDFGITFDLTARTVRADLFVVAPRLGVGGAEASTIQPDLPFDAGLVVNGIQLATFRLLFPVMDGVGECAQNCPGDVFVKLENEPGVLAANAVVRVEVRSPSGTIVETTEPTELPVIPFLQ